MSSVVGGVAGGVASENMRWANFCVISSSNVRREGMKVTREEASPLVSTGPSAVSNTYKYSRSGVTV